MSAFVPPTPPPPGDVRHRSIAELEALVIDPGAYELGSQAWLSRALLSPLWTLGVPDLRLLLTHGRGLAWLVPEALDRLRADPWAAGDYGPGELLLGLCLVDDAYWRVDPDERARLLAVLDDAARRLDELPDEAARAHWREELAAAREQFAADPAPDAS